MTEGGVGGIVKWVGGCVRGVSMLKVKRRDGQQTSLCSKIKDGRVQKRPGTKRGVIEMHQHEGAVAAAASLPQTPGDFTSNCIESTSETCRRVPKHRDASG